MHSPPTRWLSRSLAALLMGGVVLGVLPPVFGRAAVPPTVVRSVSIDPARLAPESARLARLPGGGVRLDRPTWTRPGLTCAPIRFTMVGFVWEQSGDAPVPTRVSWGDRSAPRGPVRLDADPDEGPDPGSPDDAGLAGTPALWIGSARCVRFRFRLPAEETIAGMRAVFLNTSGTATGEAPPEPDDGLLARVWGVAAPAPAQAVAAQPGVISREQWGAKESLRRCGPDYADEGLKMAYVHHTVNANGYGMSVADDLIRGIYAYHVQGRHFCDIAYNFLIDRFGRIYEGRYGGIDQPVIGAHAMGFNTGSTGIAALGTYTSATPPPKVIAAYKRLLAWRLDVAHLRPTGKAVMESAGGPTQKFDKGDLVTLPVISGHRATGYTTCPGRLATKLGLIRKAAEARGLPKIWDPVQEPFSATFGTVSVRYTAKLSQPMSWTIDIVDALGVTVRTLTGTGELVDATWDGKMNDGVTLAPPGTYTIHLRAHHGDANAREALFSLTIS